MRRSSATRSARVIGVFSLAVVVVAACGTAGPRPMPDRMVTARAALGTAGADPGVDRPSIGADRGIWGQAVPVAGRPTAPPVATEPVAAPVAVASSSFGFAIAAEVGSAAAGSAATTLSGGTRDTGADGAVAPVTDPRLASSWPAEFPGAIDAVDPVAPADPLWQPLVRRLLWGLAVATDTGERADAASDPATTAALWRVQRAAGLAATGLVDGPTVEALQATVSAPVDRLPAAVLVDLSEQRVYVANAAGAVIALFPVSTGGEGTETPTGAFAVQERIRVGTSETNAVVHMDYFTVFNGGIGFHGIPWVGDRDVRLWTPLGEYGVSHGCVRMNDADAAFLYHELPDGAPVTVLD